MPKKGYKHTEEVKKNMSEARKGKSSWNKGNHRSEEVKRKISEANKGKKATDEARKNMSEAQKGRISPMKGKTLSDEHKKKIGEAQKGTVSPMKGKTHSEESKRKMSKAKKGENNGNYGRAHSDEAKEKIGEARKGMKHTDEVKKKMSEDRKGEKSVWYGRHHSEETKEKISKANWRGGKKECRRKAALKNKNNLGFILNKKISSGIRHSLVKGGKNGRIWQSLVNYSFDELKNHLESTMPSGYTWGDIKKLHLEHIIPISAFNFDLPEHIDFKRCWALSNLRLLPKIENLKKGSKLLKPLQLCLKIAV